MWGKEDFEFDELPAIPCLSLKATVQREAPQALPLEADLCIMDVVGL